MALLKSGVNIGVLTSGAKDAFMGSLKSVTHNLTDDASRVRVGDLS